MEIDQAEPAKHHVMLHELLHLAAEVLVAEGVLKKRPPEAFITNAAGPLLSVHRLAARPLASIVRTLYDLRSLGPCDARGGVGGGAAGR